MKINISKLLFDIFEGIDKKLNPIAKKVEDVEVKIKDFTPYDDEAMVELMGEQTESIKTIEERLKELQEAEPYKFDDKEINEALKSIQDAVKELKSVKPYTFDDSEIKEAIKTVSESVQELKEADPYTFDDTEINESIKTITENVKTLLEAEPYSYDDTEITKSFETLAEVVEKLNDAEPYTFDDSEIKEEIKTVSEAVEEVKQSIPAAYDDEGIKEGLKTIKDAVKKLEEVEPYTFDDSETKNMVTAIVEDLDTLRTGQHEPYNDEGIKEALKTNSKAWGELKKEFGDMKPYDDSELKDLVKGQAETIVKLTNKLDEVEKKPLSLTIPAIVKFVGAPVKEGTFVKHNNALYLNVLKDNISEPSVDNHSYQLILEAPKPIEHKGAWLEDKTYEPTDIVMFNNASWMKTNDPAQEIPSAGWKLLAKQGKTGKPGAKGEPGDHIESDMGDAMQTMYDTIQRLEGDIKRLQNVNKI